MRHRNIVRVTRRLTETPLARMHEHAMAGRTTRRHPAIPWSKFDRAKYPQPALDLATHAQRALATGEFGAVGLFSQIATALALHGAPFDLISLATRVPTDEIRHADVATRFAQLLAAREVSFEIDRDAFESQFGKPLDQEQLDFVIADVAAVSETLAAALLSACLERAADPVAHAVFASIVSDEVHHARLGWYYLAWRAPQWTLREKQRIADRLGDHIVSIEQRFSKGRDAPAGSKKAARALGVLESEGQRDAVRRVMEDEIVPALDALGLGASHAWRIRRRAP
jgi:hypothetical protein